MGFRGAMLLLGRRHSAETLLIKFIPLLCCRDTKYSPKSAVVPPRTPRKEMTPSTSIPNTEHPHGAAPTTSLGVSGGAPRIRSFTPHQTPVTSHVSPSRTCQQSSPCPRGKGKPPTLAPARPSPAPGAGNGPGPFRPPRPRAGGSCAGAPCQGTEASTPFPQPRRPRGAPGSCDPPSTPCHPPATPCPLTLGVLCQGGGVQQSLETPVVSVPRPAVGSGPPCTGNPSSWTGLPPAGPPPAAGVSPPLPGPLAGWAALLARLIPAPARADLLRPGPMND